MEPTPAQSFHLACSWIIRDWGDFAKRDKPAAARRGDASGGVFLSGAVVLYYILYQHEEVTGVALFAGGLQVKRAIFAMTDNQ